MALGNGLVTFNGLARVGLGKRTAGQFLQTFRSAEQGGGAVGPARIGVIDGAELRSQILPRFPLARTFLILAQGFYVCLGKVVAFSRRGQGGVAGVVKADNHEAERDKKGQRRSKPAHLVVACRFGSLGLGFVSGHGFSFCHAGVGYLTITDFPALWLAYTMPAALEHKARSGLTPKLRTIPWLSTKILPAREP